MNVEAYEKCRKNFKSSLWKCVKSAGIISKQDYECWNVQRVQEVFQHQTMNVDACKDCRPTKRPTEQPIKRPNKRPTKWVIWFVVRWHTNWPTKWMGQSGQPSYVAESSSGLSLVGMRILSPSPQSAATTCWIFPCTCSPGQCPCSSFPSVHPLLSACILTHWTQLAVAG